MERVNDLGLIGLSSNSNVAIRNQPAGRPGKILLLLSPAAAVDLLLQLLDVELNWPGSFRLRNMDRKIRGGILRRSFSMTHCSTPLLEIISEWLGLVLNP